MTRQEENAANLLTLWALGEDLYRYQFEKLNAIVAQAEQRSRDRRNVEIMSAACARAEQGK